MWRMCQLNKYLMLLIWLTWREASASKNAFLGWSKYAHCMAIPRGFACARVCVCVCLRVLVHACVCVCTVAHEQKWSCLPWLLKCEMAKKHIWETGCFAPRLAVAGGDLCVLHCRKTGVEENWGEMAKELKEKLCLQPLPGEVGFLLQKVTLTQNPWPLHNSFCSFV